MEVGLLAPHQHASLVDLLVELHRFYEDPPTVDRAGVRRHLDEHLLGERSPLHLVVADDPDAGVVGLAALVLVHSLVEVDPERRRQCLVKELFVRASHRSAGVGDALMRWVVGHALDQGCGRVDWNVRAGNHNGIRFYERLGAEPVADRISFRLERPAMVRLGEAAEQN